MSKYTKKANLKSKTFEKNLDPTCAGIDVGADSIFVCALNADGKQEIREYPVFTKDLHSMADWLKERGVKSVAMESTGVYWIPIFEILEVRGFEVLLVNAHHLKNVPGRKTDVKDCQWIQQLHSWGLLRGSFRPADEYVRLRAYVRQRSKLFEDAARKIQHMHKALTQMNIQLRIAVSDITGKTGLAIIEAIIKGEKNPDKLALFRDRHCKKSHQEIAKALEGNWREEHINNLRQGYEAYEFFHKQINECEEQIEKILNTLPSIEIKEEELEKFSPPTDPFDLFSTQENQPFVRQKTKKKKKSYDRSPYHFETEPCLERLCGVDITQVPGVEGNLAVTILSEIGTDMSNWKNSKYFNSWLCLCPGNKISGGKILSGKTRKSKNKAAQALKLAANAVRNTDTFLGAYFRRMLYRKGPAKAITATAHKIGTIIYSMIKYKKSYKELGADYYEKKYRERMLNNMSKKANELGYKMVPLEV